MNPGQYHRVREVQLHSQTYSHPYTPCDGGGKYTVSQASQKHFRIKGKVHRQRAHGPFEKLYFCFLVSLCTCFNQNYTLTFKVDSIRFVSESSRSLLPSSLQSPPQKQQFSTILTSIFPHFGIYFRYCYFLIFQFSPSFIITYAHPSSLPKSSHDS